MVMPDFLNIVHRLGLKDQQHFEEWIWLQGAREYLVWMTH
jgi:hypothetical protein